MGEKKYKLKVNMFENNTSNLRKINIITIYASNKFEWTRKN